MRACRPVRVSLIMDTSNQSTSWKRQITHFVVHRKTSAHAGSFILTVPAHDKWSSDFRYNLISRLLISRSACTQDGARSWTCRQEDSLREAIYWNLEITLFLTYLLIWDKYAFFYFVSLHDSFARNSCPRLRFPDNGFETRSPIYLYIDNNTSNNIKWYIKGAQCRQSRAAVTWPAVTSDRRIFVQFSRGYLRWHARHYGRHGMTFRVMSCRDSLCRVVAGSISSRATRTIIILPGTRNEVCTAVIMT